MALQKTVTTPQGFDATNAYHRVEGVSLPDKSQLTFVLRSYRSSADAVAFHDHAYACPYRMGGANPHTQAYGFVKTLDAFSDAENV
jgi:hypothetical protein